MYTDSATWWLQKGKQLGERFGHKSWRLMGAYEELAKETTSWQDCNRKTAEGFGNALGLLEAGDVHYHTICHGCD